MDHADGEEKVPILHFLQICLSVRIQRILHGRYRNFHKMNRIFHKNGFTWETNPVRRKVPECYLRPSPRPYGLEEPFTEADACRFRTTGQGGLYHFFTKKYHTCEAVLREGLSEADDAAGCDKDICLSSALDLDLVLGLA